MKNSPRFLRPLIALFTFLGMSAHSFSSPTPALAQSTGSISGHVSKAADGSPAAQIWVHLQSSPIGACTDSSGNYTITGVVEGSYHVEAMPVAGDWCGPSSYQHLASEWWPESAANQNAQYVTISATNLAVTGIDFTLDAGGSIAGTVRDSNGNRLPNVYVSVDGLDGVGQGNCSDSEGKYWITGLPFGVSYAVSAGYSYCGVTGYALEWWQDSRSRQGATELTLTSSFPDITGIDFVLDPGSTGSISGHVIDSSGQAIIGLNVCANRYDDSTGGNCSPTDATGYYTIGNLGPGDYRVSTGWGTAWVFQFYNQTTNHWSAAPVAVVEGGSTLGIDFVLSQAGSISGTVRDGDGNPIAGIQVCANLYDGSSGGNCTPPEGTDADGYYTINNLAAGNYRVNINTPPGTPWVFQVYDQTMDWWAATPVEVVGGQTTSGIAFVLTAAGSISGTVRDVDGNPIEGLNVCANPFDDSPGGNCAPSDATGYYTIGNLAEGLYRVHTGWGSAWAAQIYNQTMDWWSATPVTVVAGQTALGIDFALSPAGSISGTVRDVDGNPIAGVQVCASPYDGSPGGNCLPPEGTDATGYYTIGNLAAGSYRVNINTPPGTPWVFQVYDQTSDWGAATPVEVVGGQTTSGIDFVLTPAGSISGVVRDVNGDPIEGLYVCASPFDDSPGGNCGPSDASGYYTIDNLAAGSYRVSTGWGTSWAFQFYNQTQDHSAATPVAVAGGQTTPGIDFVLIPAGSISGTVRDANGQPITGVSIGILAEDGNVVGACSDPATGEYVLTNVPFGVSYRVSAGHDFCGVHDFGIEYWQESATSVGATLIALSDLQPDRSGIDFTLGLSTPTGSSVSLSPAPGTTITFSDVTSPGSTSVVTSPSDPEPVPANFELLGTFYDVSTTAEFTQAQVCFDYDDAGLTLDEEQRIRLYHFVNGQPVDVTDAGYPDTAANRVCGTVDSFSPFAVLVAPYAWTGFLPPIDADGSSIFKLGSTIPVKFRLTGWSTGIMDLNARVYLKKISDVVTGTEFEPVSTSAADSGNLFRYDSGSGNYIFNLSTKGLESGTYQLRIDLGDGTTNTVNVSLRK